MKNEMEDIFSKGKAVVAEGKGRLSVILRAALMMFLAYGVCGLMLAANVVKAQGSGAAPSPTPQAASGSTVTQGADAQTTATQDGAVKARPVDVDPKVVLVTGKLELGHSIIVDVDKLSDWVALNPGNDPRKLVVYLNGRPLTGIYPEAVYIQKNRLQFHLERTADTKEAWGDLLREPVLYRPVAFTLGLENQVGFDTVYDHDNKLLLTVIPAKWGILSLVVILVILLLFITLAKKTNIIREPGPPPGPGKSRPYNLGRTQMAFWFFLVFSSYVAIWLITGDLNTITQSILGLIGISAGTALGAEIIDSSKQGEKDSQAQSLTAEKSALEARIADLKSQVAAIDVMVAADPPTATQLDITNRDVLSKELLDKQTRLLQVNKSLADLSSSANGQASINFLSDILSDGGGYSFHRFQIFAWTIVLGIIFIASVYNKLTMPEFSATLLGLMGISAGTYIGFKFPEQQK